MATTVRLDRVDTLSAVEEYGVVTHLVRRARIMGLSATDWTVLPDALAAAGIPASNSPLPGEPSLILTKRSVRLVEEDPTCVDVDLEYAHILNEGQPLLNPPFGLIVGEITATLNQTTTNLDKDGNEIVLQHTFPTDDPDWPFGTPENVQQQGGEVQFFQPQITSRYEGIIGTPQPWLLAQSIIGHINDSAWNGGDAQTWMCTNVSWKLCDATGSGRYFFKFEFQYNSDGWNPTAVFKDKRTQAPPVGLLPGIGYKVVSRHPEVDFEATIGSRIQGG